MKAAYEGLSKTPDGRSLVAGIVNILATIKDTQFLHALASMTGDDRCSLFRAALTTMGEHLAMTYTGTLLQGAPEWGGTFAGAKGTTVRQADKMATMSVGWDDIRAVGVKSTRDLAPRPVEAARQQVRPLVDQMFANWQGANETENGMIDGSRKEYKQIVQKLSEIAKNEDDPQKADLKMLRFITSDDFSHIINRIPVKLRQQYRNFFKNKDNRTSIWTNWHSWKVKK